MSKRARTSRHIIYSFLYKKYFSAANLISLSLTHVSLSLMAVFLSYDNQTLQDGLGAQALRITGIYAIAKAFGLKYLHQPITHVIEDVGQGPDGDSNQETLIANFNDFFNFPSSREPKSSANKISIRDLNLRVLLKTLLKQSFSRSDLVVSVLLPQGVINRIPLLYKVSAKYLRKSNKNLMALHFSNDIVAHVRRGYDEKYADLKYARNRHLPFSYYSDILEVLITKRMVIDGSRLLIHTDLLNSPKTWAPSQPGIVDGFNKNSGSSGEKKIYLEAFDLSKEIAIPSMLIGDIRYCDPLFNTFLDMCNAKVLIQGKSAFSYLAGIVNPNLVIYPPKQSMAKLNRWKSAEELGVQLKDPLLG